MSKAKDALRRKIQRNTSFDVTSDSGNLMGIIDNIRNLDFFKEQQFKEENLHVSVPVYFMILIYSHVHHNLSNHQQLNFGNLVIIFENLKFRKYKKGDRIISYGKP